MPPTAPATWRRRLGIDEDAFVLLSSRLVHPRYNIDTIIRALPLVLRGLPRSVLVLKELPRFSDPAYQHFCLELADELGVRDAVRIVGEIERDELLALHAAADVYVSVPRTDGTAVLVLEAMAANVPVVASDVPGIDPVILRHRETALLVPNRDAEALAAAVVAVATDAVDLVERAGEVVRLHGDFDRELDRAVTVYEELVAARTDSASPEFRTT